MSFFSKNVVVKNEEDISPESFPQMDSKLSKQEIELLLELIKQATFKGEHIETLYHLVLKLQNQYLSLD